MSDQSPLIVSISGIRGLVGESFTAEDVTRIAAAFGTTLTQGDTVILARDTRRNRLPRRRSR